MNSSSIFGESAKTGFFRLTIFILTLIGLCFTYLVVQFKGLNSEEAMDVAQLARNIAAGKGYTTDNIRPLSIWLLKQHQPALGGQLEAHPDLINPPVYPYLLSAWLKAWSPKYEISMKKGEFELFDGDLACGVLSSALFAVGVLILYFWVAKMVDPKVGTLTVALVVFCDYFWQWAISGTSWSLLFLLTVLMGWLVYSRVKSGGIGEGTWSSSIGLGLVLGAGFLTSYSFGLWLIPVLLLILIHGERNRFRDTAVVFVIFCVVAFFWIFRNWTLTGMPLGLATYSLFGGSDLFPDSSLMAAYEPDLGAWTIKSLGKKWFFYARQMWDTDLKLLGGNWIMCFFVAACFFVFKKEELQKLKWFAIYAVLTFVAILPLIWFPPAQGVTTENLWPTIAVFVFVIGAVFFLVLIDRWDMRSTFVYQTVVVLFVLLNSFGFLCAVLGPKLSLYRYPPYYPPLISKAADFLKSEPVSIAGSTEKKREWMMSDMPWAVSWYGKRPSVGLTATRKEFLKIYDEQKELSALFLTPISSHCDYVEVLWKGDLKEWMPVIVYRQVPQGFPLKGVFPMAPDFILLADPARLPAPKSDEPQQ